MAGVATWRARDGLEDARADLATARADRRGARAARARTDADRRATEATLAARTNELETLTASLLATHAGLQETTRGLTQTRTRAAASDRQVTSLDVCLAGVSGAIHGRKVATAVTALRRAQPACADALTSGTSAAFPFDFPDPAVIRVGALAYAYSTNAGAGDVQVLASFDLHRWAIVGNALPALPAWARRGSTWAPTVVARPGGYALFYTARHASTGDQCISVAAGATPQGPFVDRSTQPLVCQHELGGSIDASPYVDGAGRAWLTWKSESPPTIWSQPLDLVWLRLRGAPTPILRADRRWEGGNVEAPSLLRTGSSVVLAYSGNRWDSDAYAIGIATCATPAGPCEKRGDGPALAGGDGALGPGGAEFFLTDDGPALAYAAYLGPEVGYPASRLLHIARFDPATATIHRR